MENKLQILVILGLVVSIINLSLTIYLISKIYKDLKSKDNIIKEENNYIKLLWKSKNGAEKN